MVTRNRAVAVLLALVAMPVRVLVVELRGVVLEVEPVHLVHQVLLGLHSQLAVLDLVDALETLLELLVRNAELAPVLHQLQLLNLLVEQLGTRVVRRRRRQVAERPLRIQIERAEARWRGLAHPWNLIHRRLVPVRRFLAICIKRLGSLLPGSECALALGWGELRGVQEGWLQA